VHVAAPEIETTSNDVLSRAGWRGLCLPSPASRGVPRLGTRWIWWRADRAAAAHYRRGGELSLAGYLRSLGGHPIEAEISCSDPLPFLVAAMRGLRRRLGAGTPATRASPSRSTAPG
jgi:predicted ATP-grasp superfamily ATP-dependent carboligase